MTVLVQPPQRQPSALELAGKWTQSPPGYLPAAIKSLEPQLRREHELRKEELRQAALRESHSYVLCIMGLVAGFAIALAAIVLGKRDPALAGILAGPGLANVMAIFVLRRPGRTETQSQQAGDSG